MLGLAVDLDFTSRYSIAEALFRATKDAAGRDSGSVMEWIEGIAS
jgi:hypothetical protein